MEYNFAERADLVKPSLLRSAWRMFKPETIKFTAGSPDPLCLPNEELAPIAERVLSAKDGKDALQYNDSEGYLLLREKVKEIMKSRGIGVETDQVLMTNGSQQGIDFACRVFLDIGDTVIIEKPTYVGALNTMRNYQCNFVSVDSDSDGMIISDLEKKLETSEKVKFIYMISNFQNPSGRVWSEKRREALVKLANKYNVVVIEDDPYGELRFEGEPVPCCKSFDTEGRVLYLGSFSKVLAPGLRVGWICADKEIMEKLLVCKQTCDMHVCAFTQRVVAQYLDGIDFSDRIDTLVAFYDHRKEKMIEALDTYMPEGVIYEKPQGGLFVWLETPKFIDTTALFLKGLKHNIGIIPGIMFFADQAEDENHYIRLCYSQVNDEDMDQGIQILGELLKEEIASKKFEYERVV